MGPTAPLVAVVIEVPRGSFVKRGSLGHVDFVSPLPCPYNYGSVPTHIGLEGDLLDAIVLGPRLQFGSTVSVPAWGAVTLVDRGLADDKLICGTDPPTHAEREAVLRFFRFYARCKGLLNLWRGRSGRNACDGWRSAESALARHASRRGVARAAHRVLTTPGQSCGPSSAAACSMSFSVHGRDSHSSRLIRRECARSSSKISTCRFANAAS